jgi:nucleotide-binding universal stress UspA family protein
MQAAVHYLERPRARRLERIIVGHDLNAGGAAAFTSALVLARRSDASIRLIHTVEPHSRSAHCCCLDECQCSVEERVAGAGADLEEIIERRLDCRHRLNYEVRFGKPFRELILAACAWHADLIVVGGPHRGSFRLWGGTAERLARKTFMPVLVTPRPLTAVPERFLIATDFSLAALQAAGTGIRLAKNLGARIFFVHALDPTSWYGYASDQETLGLMMIPKLTAADIEKDWVLFLKSLSLDCLAWEFCTVEGPPAATIVKHAEEIHADLIIMGGYGRTGLEHLFLGSVKEAVIRKAQAAVLTIGREARSFCLPQVDAKKRFHR